MEWGDRMQRIQGILGRYTECKVGMRHLQGAGADLYKGCKVYKLSFFGEDGVLPPVILINPYLGQNVQKNGKSSHLFANLLTNV